MFYFKKTQCLENASQKECYFWNLMGSLASAMTSILFSIIVARACLPMHSDIFSIAYALATQMWTIANFESGTLLVTDTKDKYSQNDYYSFKILMIAISLLATIVVVMVNFALNRYNPYKAMIVTLFCVYKIAEAFSNYYYSIFQKYEHLNIAGFSMFARTALSIVVFAIVIFAKGGLALAIVALLVVCIGWTFLYEKNFCRAYGKTKLTFNMPNVFKVLFECAPLFLSSFLITYLINIPKYSIDTLLSADSGIQTAYNAIFQPAAIINLFCLFVFRPTLTGLARLYNDGEYKKYIKMAFKIFLVTVAFAAVALLAAAFLGIPVLQIFYGKNYISNQYTTALIFIIIGGAFYAFAQLLYNMITVIRCQYFMLIGYLVALVVSLLCSDRLVALHGIHGAAAVYMIAMIVLTLSFLTIFIVAFNISKSKNANAT